MASLCYDWIMLMPKLLFIFIILLSSKILALEIKLLLPVYEPLSKSYNTLIPGSSKIIIDKNKILKYGNTPIHNIIDLEAGIKSRSIYGSNSSGSKTTIDMRGMGAQAKSNVLILINGQRLNNIDMSEIDFPSIPKESVDRIEIIKGNAASVLYGDGAIGGIINIITNPSVSKKITNEIILKNGTYDSHEVIWNRGQKINDYSINTYINYHETDGYRQENEQKQSNFTSEIRRTGKRGDHFFTINISEQIMSTPSDRSQDQLFDDRRGSDTPDDYINSLGGALLYSMDRKLNDSSNLFLNASFRVKNSYSDLQSTSFPSYNDTSLTNYQFTPRIKNITKIFNKNLESLIGLDIQYADYKSYRKENEESIPLHVYDAWQTTQSLYTQQSLKISNKTTLGAGIRYQINKIGIGDVLDTNAPDYAGWQTEHSRLNEMDDNYALNIGLDKQIYKKINIYGRVGTGFRYPNIDDRIGGSGGTSLDLKTQTSQDLEFGTKYFSEFFEANLSSYLIESKNELAYDSDAFENMNMDSTRRYGIELNTNNQISSNKKLINNFTFARAHYTSGDQGSYATDFNNKEVPLVPMYSLDSSLDWKISDYMRIIPEVKYQDDMRMESDDENFQNTKIPSYIIANLNMLFNFDKFFSKIMINNLFDEKYYNYAVASSGTLGSYNAYPEPGREIIFSVGINFNE